MSDYLTDEPHKVLIQKWVSQQEIEDGMTGFILAILTGYIDDLGQGKATIDDLTGYCADNIPILIESLNKLELSQLICWTQLPDERISYTLKMLENKIIWARGNCCHD